MFTRKYYITVLTVVLGGSAQFYSYGIVNPAQILITQWINETYTERGSPLSLTASNLIWSFVVSSIAIGAILGASMTRIMAEKCGRRNGLIANGIVNVVGAVLEVFSKSFKSPELLILGRFIFGANMGLTSGLVPMYLMEITPNKYRGPAGTLHQIAVAFSDWFSLLIGLPEVLGGPNTWPLAFAFPGIPALALCIILPFCPESPKYTLATVGNRDQAKHDIEVLVGPLDAKPMFESLIKEVALDQGQGTFRDLFTRKDLRIPLVVSIFVMIAQQFTGCTAVFAYSTDMFLNAKLSPDVARYSTLAIGIVYFLFACSSPFLIDTGQGTFRDLFTRKDLRIPLVVSIFVMIAQQFTGCTAVFAYSTDMFLNAKLSPDVARYSTLAIGIVYFLFACSSPFLIDTVGRRPLLLFQLISCLIALTILSVFTFLQNQRSMEWASYGTIFALVLYMCVYGVGSPIPWMITGELFNQQMVGVSYSYLPFIIIITISIIIMYILLPETRDRNIDEIVYEVRHRTNSLSSGRPWEAIRPESRAEMRRLIDTMNQRMYHSNSSLDEI